MKKVKLIPIVLTLIAITSALCSCSDRQKDNNKKVAQTNTVTTAYTAETTSSLPEDEFLELPDEAMSDFDYISKITGDIFPDAAGKKMYGYLGECEVNTENGMCDCYVFAYYTYKSKLYNKIGFIAKAVDSADIYTSDEADGSYSAAVIPEPETHWYDKSTLALAVNAADGLSTDMNVEEDASAEAE